MKYLLDTCTVSDFVKGEKNTLDRIKSTNPSELSLSSISLMEIEYGLRKNPQKAQLIRSLIHDFLETVYIFDFGVEEATHAGLIRVDLTSNGKPIDPYDLLIAATALHNNLIIVTSNMNEFQRVKGISCENWRKSN